jgi:hypothetical protein
MDTLIAFAPNETARVHHAARRHGSVAARGARAAAGDAADHWVFGPHTPLLDSQRPVAFVERLRRRDLAHKAATSARAAKSVRNLVLRPSADSTSMDGNGARAASFFCGSLASTLEDSYVGFSTRRDDPSN